MIIRTALAVVVAAGALAACSSSPGASTDAAAPNTSVPATSAAPVEAGAGVCDYLTRSDVTPYGDQVFFPGRKTHDWDYGPSCDYGAVVFSLVDPDVSAKAFSYGAAKTVSDLGDHAYYSHEGHWLRVAAGKNRFQVQCRLCPDPELTALTATARSLVPRLPG